MKGAFVPVSFISDVEQCMFESLWNLIVSNPDPVYSNSLITDLWKPIKGVVYSYSATVVTKQSITIQRWHVHFTKVVCEPKLVKMTAEKYKIFERKNFCCATF